MAQENLEMLRDTIKGFKQLRARLNKLKEYLNKSSKYCLDHGLLPAFFVIHTIQRDLNEIARLFEVLIDMNNRYCRQYLPESEITGEEMEADDQDHIIINENAEDAEEVSEDVSPTSDGLDVDVLNQEKD